MHDIYIYIYTYIHTYTIHFRKEKEWEIGGMDIWREEALKQPYINEVSQRIGEFVNTLGDFRKLHLRRDLYLSSYQVQPHNTMLLKMTNAINYINITILYYEEYQLYYEVSNAM
jgi:hypothetical protein